MFIVSEGGHPRKGEGGCLYRLQVLKPASHHAFHLVEGVTHFWLRSSLHRKGLCDAK